MKLNKFEGEKIRFDLFATASDGGSVRVTSEHPFHFILTDKGMEIVGSSLGITLRQFLISEGLVDPK